MDKQNVFVNNGISNAELKVHVLLRNLTPIPSLKMDDVSISFDMEINEADKDFNQKKHGKLNSVYANDSDAQLKAE